MKYTLVLGIAYKKYKYPGYKLSPGNIVVYVGGRLIDAFQIDQDVTFVRQDTVTSLLDETWYSRLGLTRWLARLENYNESNDSMPKLFKIYEIEEQDLNGLVEIKVDNSHSDHNNGFMKNSSMIRFPVIGLFPSHFVENGGEQLMRILKKISEGGVKHEKRAGCKDLSDPRLFHTWPCVGSFYTRRQSEKFEKNKELKGYCWIGGDFTAEIPIKTKHRIKYLSSMSGKMTGFFESSFRSLIIATCKQLLNIYNEDQRSNRTKD